MAISDQITWKNCYADVLSASYREIALSFLNEVVDPSIDVLGIQIEKWRKPLSVFIYQRLGRSIPLYYVGILSFNSVFMGAATQRIYCGVCERA